MRQAKWLVAGYSLTAGAVVLTLLGGHVGAAHAVAFLPFAVLVLAITTGARPPGWALATAGLGCTSLLVLSFASLTGDRLGQVALPAAAILLALALYRAGARAAIARHRGVTLAYVLVAGFFAIDAIVGIAVTLGPALKPHPGCVDTCWGDGLGLFLSTVYLAEVLLVTVVAIAFARSWITGLGALATVAAENVLFFTAPPGPSLAYLIGLIGWYGGLFLLALPWSAPLPDLVLS
jgi:hypothetical protein